MANEIPPPETKPKAPRRDRLRNQLALISAARSAFAADGPNVSLDRIAKEAGVGIGTLYRHFPTRIDLWGAVLLEPLQQQLNLLREALDDDDPWAGFAGYVIASCEQEADLQCFLDLMAARFMGDRQLAAIGKEIQEKLIELIARAHDAAVIRPDFTPQDLAFIMLANSRICEATRDIAPSAWRRNVELFLDSVRPERATPLTEPPLTPRQVARSLRRSREKVGRPQ